MWMWSRLLLLVLPLGTCHFLQNPRRHESKMRIFAQNPGVMVSFEQPIYLNGQFKGETEDLYSFTTKKVCYFVQHSVWKITITVSFYNIASVASYVYVSIQYKIIHFNTSDTSQYFSILLLYNHTFLVIFQSLCLSCFLQRKNALFSSGFDGWNMTNDKFRSSNVTYIVRVELSNKKFKENRIRRHFKRFWLPGAVWVERSVRDQNIYNRCVCSSSAAEYNF